MFEFDTILFILHTILMWWWWTEIRRIRQHQSCCSSQAIKSRLLLFLSQLLLRCTTMNKYWILISCHLFMPYIWLSFPTVLYSEHDSFNLQTPLKSQLQHLDNEKVRFDIHSSTTATTPCCWLDILYACYPSGVKQDLRFSWPFQVTCLIWTETSHLLFT